jgi:hypothetical protein
VVGLCKVFKLACQELCFPVTYIAYDLRDVLKAPVKTGMK